MLFSSPFFKNRIAIITILIAFISILEISFSSRFLNHYEQRSSDFTLLFFIGVTAFYSIGICIVLRYLSVKKNLVTSETAFKIIVILVFTTISLFAIIILQMLFYNFYNLTLFKVIIFINYLFSIIFLVLLCNKLFTWLKASRNIFIFFYLISVISLIMTESIILIKVQIEFNNDPALITALPNPWDSYSSNDTIYQTLLYYSVISNFIILWIGTILFIKNFVGAIGRVKFLFLSVLPIIFFLAPLDITYVFVKENIKKIDPYLAAIITLLLFGAVRQIAGLFFALSFFVLNRRLELNKDNSNLSYALIVAGMGIILFFSANQSSLLIVTPYPPFSIGLVPCVLLSSYLIYEGFYNIAINSKNKVLANIVKSYLSESQKKFLKDLGESEINILVDYLNSKVKELPSTVQNNINDLEKDDLIELLRVIEEENANFRRGSQEQN